VPRNWASFTALSLPIVAVRIGGTIVRALADTGASQSLIDPHLVKQLGVAEKGSGWIVGIVASPIQVPLVSVAGVSIGQCSLKPFKAGVIDLANLRIGVQLVLGINAFVGYRLQFDFAEGRLYLLS
jgi:predicted aspartyl protease